MLQSRTGRRLTPALIAVFLLSAGCVTEPVEKNSSESRTLLKVTHVFDAGTIGLSNGVKVRYAGLKSPKGGLRPEKGYDVALEIHRGMLEGATVRVAFPADAKLDFDPTKVYPAFVWLRKTVPGNEHLYEDVLVNAELLRLGAGTLAPDEVEDAQILDSMRKAAEEAKRKRRGIYSK